ITISFNVKYLERSEKKRQSEIDADSSGIRRVERRMDALDRDSGDQIGWRERSTICKYMLERAFYHMQVWVSERLGWGAMDARPDDSIDMLATFGESQPPKPQGPPDDSKTMPPKRLRRAAVEQLIGDRVAEAIAEHERNRPHPSNVGGAVNVLGFDQIIIYDVSTDVDTAYSLKSGNGLEFFKVIAAPTIPVFAEENLRDLIDIRVDIIHPEPVAAVSFLTAAVEELIALRFRVDIAETKNASLCARIKTTEAIEKINHNRKRQARVNIEQYESSTSNECSSSYVPDYTSSIAAPRVPASTTIRPANPCSKSFRLVNLCSISVLTTYFSGQNIRMRGLRATLACGTGAFTLVVAVILKGRSERIRIMSSLDYEEAGHKLLKLKLNPEQENTRPLELALQCLISTSIPSLILGVEERPEEIVVAGNAFSGGVEHVWSGRECLKVRWKCDKLEWWLYYLVTKMDNGAACGDVMEPTSVLVKWLSFTNRNSNEAQTSVSAYLDGEIFSEGKKCRESNIGDSDNTGDGGKIVGGAIGACGGIGEDRGDMEKLGDELARLKLGLKCCLVLMVPSLNLLPKEAMWPLGSQVESLRFNMGKNEEMGHGLENYLVLGFLGLN
nr:hypothetical protein [Tanacetum cinerariifolium]